jgi:transitional endoplasmic reticulum ATPase
MKVNVIEVSSKDVEFERQSELLRRIAELGGRGIKEEDIVYTGVKMVLPERFRGDVQGAIDWLKEKRDEEEEPSSFVRNFKFRPWDGAYNAFQAMKKAFGMVAGKTTWNFFTGPNPPKYTQVPVSVTETEEVPWGQFEVPVLKDTKFNFGSQKSKEHGQVFSISITSPRKNRFIIEGLFKLIADELENHSIYRGKAIDGQEHPQFIDLRGFDESRVIYSDQVQSDLDAHLFGVMRYSKATRELGLPLKRALLLTGPYGTGKTLAGFKTALEAQAAGWTFIMARPGRDDFEQVMQTARLYQPAVVFMEDAETVASVDNVDAISKVLDLFDGIQAKTTDLVVVLTTNKPEELHKGMMRPGRLDAIIEINALDAHGIERLIRVNIGDDRLAPDIDFGPIVEACEGYMPAFVKEAADRAVRYALARSHGSIGNYEISTDDLVYAAGGLRSQFNRMQDAPEVSTADTLVGSLEKVVLGGARKAVAQLAASPDDASGEVWKPESLALVESGNGNGKH